MAGIGIDLNVSQARFSLRRYTVCCPAVPAFTGLPHFTGKSEGADTIDEPQKLVASVLPAD
jgi:hypothetical protein